MSQPPRSDIHANVQGSGVLPPTLFFEANGALPRGLATCTGPTLSRGLATCTGPTHQSAHAIQSGKTSSALSIMSELAWGEQLPHSPQEIRRALRHSLFLRQVPLHKWRVYPSQPLAFNRRSTMIEHPTLRSRPDRHHKATHKGTAGSPSRRWMPRLRDSRKVFMVRRRL